MRYKFKFFAKFFIYLVFIFSCSLLISNTYSQDITSIDPVKELKKGNFLIGIRQHIGNFKNNSLNNQILYFKTRQNFLKLYSSNGIVHKSRKINIKWKNIALETPYTSERLVLGPFQSFESAKKQANVLLEKGYKPVIAYPKNWEVWLPSTTELPKENKFKLVKIFYEYETVPFLINEFNHQKLEGPIFIDSQENIIINNVNYGKSFYLIKDSYGSWTLIQKINFNDYLKGVLPHEIGAQSPKEALKSQAIIARTWAIYNSDRFNIDKYHLCITTQCQVYKPEKKEYKNVEEAIKETSDLILVYKGEPINAFYHASNGGISARASEAWEMEDLYYLNEMIDGLNILGKNLKLPILNQSELINFLENVNEKAFGDKHYLFRWQKKITSKEIRNYLIKSQLINENVKKINLIILERGFSGRVLNLEVQTNQTNKSILLTKDEIRRVFKFLPSTLFTIDKLNDNFWVFQGGGFGHGVGLSQAGAIEMAKQGSNYETILKHYYKGARIKNLRNYLNNLN